MKRSMNGCWGILYLFSALSLLSTHPDFAFAQSNPCAATTTRRSQNPRAPANPCSAKNPCAANPCAPGGKAGAAAAKAITVRGEVAKVDPSAKKLVLKRDVGQLDLSVSQHSVIRQGAKLKRLGDLKPGDKVMVSYVDTGKERTAWYVYAGFAAMANPCAAVNPCSPKAKKGSANPCGANPCAAKGKQSAKNPCAANPCGAKNPCAAKGVKGR